MEQVIPRIVEEFIVKDPLCSTLYITDIGFYAKAVSHFALRDTPIDQYVFIYCVDGEGWYKVEGKRYRLMANQFCILPAGVPHSYGSDRKMPWTIYWLHFKGTHAAYFCPASRGPVSLGPADESSPSKSRQSYRVSLFLEMYDSLSEGPRIETLRYVTSLLYHYLGARIHAVHKSSVQGAKRDVVSSAISFMEENITRSLTLDSICKHVNYSPSRLTALFRMSVGQSPLAYFNALKIHRACSILEEGGIRINELCEKVGIQDPYYFSRLFKKVMGMPPKEYCANLSIRQDAPKVSNVLLGIPSAPKDE